MPISLEKTNDKSSFSTFHFQSADVAKQRYIEITKFSAQIIKTIRIAWRFGYFLYFCKVFRKRHKTLLVKIIAFAIYSESSLNLGNSEMRFSNE